MLKSMTAFGRGELENRHGRFSVEIQSVNRKYLELNITLPKHFNSFEPELRKVVGKMVARGKVSININAELNADEVALIKPNIGYAKATKKAYEEIAKSLGYRNDIDLISIIRNKEVLDLVQNIDNLGQFWAPVKKASLQAIGALDKMKRAEGKSLNDDIAKRLNKINNSLKIVKRSAKGAVDRYRRRLQEKIAELTRNNNDNEDKILREVAIYADRTDVTEEITRLESHIKQFADYMKSNEPVGRTLDFLVQEMNREANTIGSKTYDLSISNAVVQIKSELERIREQVQNIE